MDYLRRFLDIMLIVFLWAVSTVVIGVGARLMLELFCFGYRCGL